MLKYCIEYTNGIRRFEDIQCHDASIHEGVFIFRNASGQVLLAVPVANIASVRLNED